MRKKNVKTLFLVLQIFAANVHSHALRFKFKQWKNLLPHSASPLKSNWGVQAGFSEFSDEWDKGRTPVMKALSKKEFK